MDLIERMSADSEGLSNIEDIESLIQRGIDLNHMPILPLYTIFKRSDPFSCSKILDNMTEDQRQTLLDIDLWYKDDIDIEHFHFWPLVYSKASDNIRLEFAKSSSFSLFLKSKFNIWTFDIEDPHYPEHNNYFLTEDNLLLFEYEQDYKYLDEIKGFIKDIYTNLGVENAYAHLMKIVSETFFNMLEEEYRFKKSRLLDYGLVDYYDALEMTTPYPNLNLMNKAVFGKKTSTGTLSQISLMQNLHRQLLTVFEGQSGPLKKELSKVCDEKRLYFLQFNFLKLINASLVLDNSLKKSSIAMRNTCKIINSYLLLGLDYLFNRVGMNEHKSLFDRFEFSDIYLCGKTLVCSQQKTLKKALNNSVFKEDRTFLGAYWMDFLKSSLQTPLLWAKQQGKVKSVTTFSAYTSWSQESLTFIQFLPFAEKFALSFFNLKNSGSIRNEFYLNYSVDDIDLESLMLNSLANFVLGFYAKTPSNKMGLTLDEFKAFTYLFTVENTEKKNKEIIANFIRSFGLHNVSDLEDYILYLVKNHLEGYDYKKLQGSDYRYVGGPIVLNQ